MPSDAAMLLALLQVPKVGPLRLTTALAASGSVAGLADEADRLWPGAGATLERWLPRMERRVDLALATGLEVLTASSTSYPLLLGHREVPPPPVLFSRGSLPRHVLASHEWELSSVGIVGTRRASALGVHEARYLGEASAAAGAVVVSGLALGIDAEAHRGALDARRHSDDAAPTVAVLGGSHDRLHPSRHAALADEIVEAGGAVISEHPPGTPPIPSSFLRRNRIIAALSAAVVVVEAGARSGALNTVSHANRLGRPVLTVPARPSDRHRAGNLELLRDGAAPLIDLTDLAGAIQDRGIADRLVTTVLGGTDSGMGSGTEREPGSATARTPARPQEGAEGSPGAEGLDGAVQVPCPEVLEVVEGAGSLSFDAALARVTQIRPGRPLTPAELAGCLARLEAKGLLSRGDDGRFRPTRRPRAAAEP